MYIESTAVANTNALVFLILLSIAAFTQRTNYTN